MPINKFLRQLRSNVTRSRSLNTKLDDTNDDFHQTKAQASDDRTTSRKRSQTASTGTKEFSVACEQESTSAKTVSNSLSQRHEDSQSRSRGHMYPNTFIDGHASLHQGDFHIENATFHAQPRGSSDEDNDHRDMSLIQPYIAHKAKTGDFEDYIQLALAQVDVSETSTSRSYMINCIDLLHQKAELLEWFETARPKRRAAIQERFRNAYSEATTNCRDSLAFDNLMLREDIIDRPQEQTCRWIYDTTQYLSWVSPGSRILWLKGKPGSGKSILMKSLYEKRKEAIRGTSTVLLRFFFNARGAEIEKTRSALYRTLLLNIMDQSPHAQCQVIGRYLEKTKDRSGHKVVWQAVELANIFHDLVEHFDDEDIEILIDALDEGTDAEVLDVVRRFEHSVQAKTSSRCLRVCWSSRFYPHISLRITQSMDLIVDEFNTNDIRIHVQRAFSNTTQRSLQGLGEDIIRRAKGVFLWASLVLDRLLAAFDAGSDVSDLHNILRDIPEDLEDLFLDIYKISAMTAPQQQQLRWLVSIVLGSFRPLSLQEVYAAFKLDSSECSLTAAVPTVDGAEQFRKRITYISRGLIEAVDPFRFSDDATILWADGICYPPIQIDKPIDEQNVKRLKVYDSRDWRNARVQVIHESVRDFYFQRGLSIVQMESKDVLLCQGHAYITEALMIGLSKICQSHGRVADRCRDPEYFEKDDILNDLTPPPSWRPPPLSFLVSYAQDHFADHLGALCTGSLPSTHSALQSTSFEQRRQALFAFLFCASHDALKRDGIPSSFISGVTTLTNLASNFGIDAAILMVCLDWPIRLLTIVEYLRRCNISLHLGSNGSNSLSTISHSQFSVSFATTFEPILSLFVEVDRRDDKVAQHDDTVSLNNLCTVTFQVSTETAPRLWLDSRLQPDHRKTGAENIHFVVDAHSVRFSRPLVNSERSIPSHATFSADPRLRNMLADDHCLVTVLRSHTTEHENTPGVSKEKQAKDEKLHEEWCWVDWRPSWTDPDHRARKLLYVRSPVWPKYSMSSSVAGRGDSTHIDELNDVYGPDYLSSWAASTPLVLVHSDDHALIGLI